MTCTASHHAFSASTSSFDTFQKKPKRVLKASLVEEDEDKDKGGGSAEASDSDDE